MPAVRLPVEAASNLLAAVRGLAGDDDAKMKTDQDDGLEEQRRKVYNYHSWISVEPTMAFDSVVPVELYSL